jgi:hypothetical protein
MSKWCAFGWLAHSRNAKPRLFTEDTPMINNGDLTPIHYDGGLSKSATAVGAPGRGIMR